MGEPHGPQAASDLAVPAGPRLLPRVWGCEAALTVAELLVIGVPLVTVGTSAGGAMSVLLVAGVMALALFAAQVVRLFDNARPLLAVLHARAARKPVSQPAWQRAQRAFLRLPWEDGWARSLAWLAVAATVVGTAVVRGSLPVGRALGIGVVTLIDLAGLAAVRTLSLEAVLARFRHQVFPSADAIRVFADTYRTRLSRVAVAVAGIGYAVFAALAAAAAGLDSADIGLLALLALPVLLVAALSWWRSLVRRCAPIETYFDGVLRSPSTRGPSREEPSAVTAFIAAQAVPYRLASYLGITMSLALLGAIAAGRWLLQRDAYAAARMLLAAAVVVLPATLTAVLALRRTLLPLLAHLGSRHHLPLDRIRSPVGLGAKLVGYLVTVAFSAAGLALLGLSALGRPAGLVGQVVIAAVGVPLLACLVILMVRDLMAPVVVLDGRSDEMARGELARPVPLAGEADEIGRLTVAFEEMRRALRDRLRSTESLNVDLEREVRRRTEALERRNTELHEAMDKLQKAQDDLVRSEKLASMGRLVAGIAHEVNNPVNAVINTLQPLREVLDELARKGSGDGVATLCGDAEEMLNVIQRGADRTRAIVRALHNYSRSDETTFRDVDLQRCVTDTLDLLRHQLRGLETKIDVTPGLKVRGLASQIDQALMNLVANAAQAIGDRPGHIEIGVVEQGDDVVITVADDGPGIPQDVLPRIFDPFYTTKNVGEGSGLGLSIVHGIVERHGGRISVHSQPGQGARFTMVLPRAGVRESGARPSQTGARA